MATIYAGTGDSYAGLTDSSSWANARGTVTSSASVYSSTTTSHDFAVYNLYSGGRGGNTYFCRRSYFPFDLSGESGTIASATISLYLDNLGTVGVEDNVTLVEATALGGTSAEYGNCYTSGTTLGTEIVTNISTSTTAGYHIFTVNSGGITAMQSKIGSGTFAMCLMGYRFDNGNTAPSLGGGYTKIKCYYANYTGTSRDPKIDITYAVAVTDNSVFFGCNF
jgi:hypothetical protein